MNLLIADSGATKTDWAWLAGERPVYIRTSGLHPAYLEKEPVLAELREQLGHLNPEQIRFYGAGCYSEASAAPVRSLLETLFNGAGIEIHDDLTAVAHATLGRERGVAGILGTGSNSGYFEEGRCIKQVPALGYLLGDEGSAADIGKRILRKALREEFTPATLAGLRSRLESLDYRTTVHDLYHTARPSRFLASITAKALAGTPSEELLEVVEESIRAFVEQHLMRYEGIPGLELVLAGGVARHQQPLIERVLHDYYIDNVRFGGEVIRDLVQKEEGER